MNSRTEREWQWTTLGQVADPAPRSIVSGPFGSNIGSRFFVESGVPVIRGNNLTEGREKFIDDGFVFLTEEKAAEFRNCEAYPLDLVFTAAGSIGQVGIIPSTAKYPKYIISNKQLRARLDTRRLDPLFAFYWFSSQPMVDRIKQSNTGSTIPLINLSVLRSLPVPLPPLEEQRSIAHILGTLDDKIELNRRMCATLEEMARAIFRSWFVDFDPVRAKVAAIAEGRDPERAAMAAISGKKEEDLDTLPAETLSCLRATAALFPSSFTDSELGEIPEGWRISPFGDVATVKRGVSYKSSELAPSSTALVTLKSFARGGGYREDGLKEYTGPYKPEQEVELGDLVIAHTDVTQAAEVIGRPALISSSAGYQRLIISLDVAVVRPTSTTYKRFLYGIASTQAFNDHMLSYTSGTTVLHLSNKAVPTFRFADPGEELVSLYDGVATPLFAQVQLLIEQSRTLAALRDTLLPKLLSGELQVNGARALEVELA